MYIELLLRMESGVKDGAFERERKGGWGGFRGPFWYEGDARMYMRGGKVGYVPVP